LLFSPTLFLRPPSTRNRQPSYHGGYSNRARGERRKQGLLRPGDEPAEGCSNDVTVLNVSEYDPPRLTSKTWRQLIHKVWDVDPLVRPR